MTTLRTSRRWLQRRVIGISAVFGCLLAGTTALAGTANADVPEPALSAFTAQACPGTTFNDPSQQTTPIVNLLTVDGPRLEAYGAGSVVPLYAADGTDSTDPYPPICGVRDVDGVGPVSQWMFCTDLTSHSCAGTNEDGDLVAPDGQVLDPYVQTDENPRLTADQNKLIAYLIQHGHSYTGFGYYGSDNAYFDTDTARQDGTTANREALQVLIWCISDAPEPDDYTDSSEQDAYETCQASMSDAEQARLLAQIPESATITLSFADSDQDLQVGDQAGFVLATNLYEQPITFDVAGPAGVWSVLSGDATLDNGTLTVHGSDPAQTTTVVLGFTAEEAGTVSVTASGIPADSEHIEWNQTLTAVAGGCQVFATFDTDTQQTVASTAAAVFVDAFTPTTDPSTPADTETTTPATTTSGSTPSASATAATVIAAGSTGALATTGASAAPVAFCAAGLVVAGALALIVARRRHTRLTEQK